MDRRFKDKVAIITGAASGIGKAVAYRLGQEGAVLALFDINADDLEKTAREFMAKGMAARTYPMDISKEDQVMNAVGAVEKDRGKIDVLVHAAGIVGPTNTKVTAYETADFDRVYTINLKGAFLITKYTLKAMS